jgi:hypothetical protein
MKTKIKPTFSTALILVVAFALIFIPAGLFAAKPVPDADGDTFTTKEGDCNDADPEIHPDALEVCDDGVDNNCDGDVDVGEGCGGGGDLDSDEDGFPDSTEQAVIYFEDGLTLNNGFDFIRPCEVAAPLEECVQWDRPDVFIIINRASPSNIENFDPLSILRTFTNSAGSTVVPHELIEESPGNRLISDGQDQHAIRIKEYLNTDSGPLGFAPTGMTPNTEIPGAGEVAIYTNRIKSEIDRICNTDYTFRDKKGDEIAGEHEPDTCQIANGKSVDMTAYVPNLDPLYNLYIMNVLAHEAWHAIALAPSDSADVTLHHYNPNSGWIEEQSIGIEAKLKAEIVTVTLYISDEFHPDSKANYKLK